MADPRDPTLDDARNGGGIGDIGRQPVDPSSENRGNAEPRIEADPDEDRPGIVERDVDPTDEDPDEDADSTLGVTP